jgi:LysM repeat protein
MNKDQSPTPLSLLSDPKQQGRSRVKVAVFSVLAFHVAGLTALLLTQGCKREVPPPDQDNGLGGGPGQPEVPMLDSNAAYYTESNPPTDITSVAPTNTYIAPPEQNIGQPVPPVPLAGQTSEYVVKAGDSFYTIAKNHNTTIKAMEAANPGVDSRKLKIGQKLVLPAPTSTTTTSATSPVVPDANVYTVKSGDTLSHIATVYKTTVKELKSLNGLTTDRINVGQKLKLPPPPAPAPVPMTEPLPVTPTAPTGQ